MASGRKPNTVAFNFRRLSYEPPDIDVDFAHERLAIRQ
jgi:hypothetical protein